MDSKLSCNINFQKKMENILNEIKDSGRTPGLLLHSCCGPCSSYVISLLMEYFDITVFFYNPNIYPFDEYSHRLKEQIRLIDEYNKLEYLEYEINGKLVKRPRKKHIDIIEGKYDHEIFLKNIKGLEHEKEGGARCAVCFRLRLEETARKAEELGFDFFTTTLSVSPRKNAVLLNHIGTGLSESFLVSDFKKKEGYKTSIIISKMFYLYRQERCGCEFAMRI